MCSDLFALVKTEAAAVALLGGSSQKAITVVKSTRHKNMKRFLVVCLGHKTL